MTNFYSPYINHFIQPDTIIPNPSDPQSWNRYSYVQNNPIRYTDPTGHYECMVESDGSCAEVRKLHLWKYSIDTLKELGGKDDLEAMIRIVDKAADLYGNYEEMMPVLSGIFLGVEESNPLTILHAAGADSCAGLGREPKDCALHADAESFWNEGFHRDFQDGHNQVFHFWAYLATAASTDTSGLPANYLWGSLVAVEANAFHEVYWPWTDPAGASWQDYGLSAAGINIGMLVSMGAVSPNQLGNTIRSYVGTNSPGYPSINLLTTILPLPGNWMNP